MIHIQRSFV